MFLAFFCPSPCISWPHACNIVWLHHQAIHFLETISIGVGLLMPSVTQMYSEWKQSAQTCNVAESKHTENEVLFANNVISVWHFFRVLIV